MANTQSALKEIRKNTRRRARNRLVRTSTRTYTKRAVQAIDDDATDAEEVVRSATRALDRAASKGVLHKNAAARRKSRLLKKVKARANPS